MALLDTVNWHWFGKALEREILDEHGLDFGRCDGKPSTSCEVDFVGRRYPLHARGERKRLTDEVAILNGDIVRSGFIVRHRFYALVGLLSLRQFPVHWERMKVVCNFESLPYGVDTVASEVGLQFLTTGHLSLKSGFPNKDGINSSRNKSNCTLAPTDRPASLFNGTTASAATCQLTAT